MRRAVIKVRPSHARATVACLALVAAGVAWSSPADATPDFPAAVDSALGLTGANTVEEKVAPKDGCLLCHTTEAGGAMALTRFGTEMHQNGAVEYDAKGTAAGALMAIEASDPLAISDIEKGINPNDDPKWLSGSTSTDPQPAYGCGASVSRGSPNSVGTASLLASIMLALFAGGVLRRRRGRPTGCDASERTGVTLRSAGLPPFAATGILGNGVLGRSSLIGSPTAAKGPSPFRTPGHTRPLGRSFL